jgi:hypothetical protein
MAALNAAVELEGKLKHDTYVPPFALYELGAVHCAQAQMQEAADVFAKCAAVSYDFNFEVQATRRACTWSLIDNIFAGAVPNALGGRVSVDGAE